MSSQGKSFVHASCRAPMKLLDKYIKDGAYWFFYRCSKCPFMAKVKGEKV